ncbi:MAG: altronate dehydratase family protein [Microscillaceae bacterium]|nr:altronate dehydratase family protein [Microscillaceae bacterium]
MMQTNYIQLDPNDNVLTALQNLEAGAEIIYQNHIIKIREHIRAKHKFPIQDFKTGDKVRMYGTVVGECTQDIAAGALISQANIKHATQDYSTQQSQFKWQAPDVSRWKDRTFKGFHRADGQVGTANYWIVIPLVFCENRNIKVMQASLLEALGYPGEKEFSFDISQLIALYQSGAEENAIFQSDILRKRNESSQNRVFPNVDGIKFLTHEGGCGGTRQDAQSLCNLLAGYITNPNVAGATVLSLGCQHAQIPILQAAIQARDPQFAKPVYYLEQQNSKSEPEFIAEALKKTFIGLTQANTCQRKPAPLSKLVLGLECGGSDGFSGITANPVLGRVSDLLVALGGSSILSEFPELNGVEQELINRCARPDLAEKFSDLMRTYSERAVAVGSGFENNPSPGNIREGLITDAIKSAGAAKKGGTSPVKGVLDYTEPLTATGLNLLCTPGNDVESTTALAGSGANIVVFTTGLGTPTGNPITPVVKMSSNSEIYARMRDIIDFDAGTIVRGESTIEGKAEELLEYLIEVASGEEIPAAVRLGQDDFIPWKRGVSL